MTNRLYFTYNTSILKKNRLVNAIEFNKQYIHYIVLDKF